MFSMQNQVTPMHTHRVKKEDIICRAGSLALELWRDHPHYSKMGDPVVLKRNGAAFTAESGRPFTIAAGERMTIAPGIYHAFRGHGGDCIVGEVSTGNDDANDNFFIDPGIGRFPRIEEDEPATVRLISER
jgi:D-lyxose ketol-isomerase